MNEPRLTDEQWGQIETSMATGQIEEAVALVRQFTGCGLAEARDVIENYDKEEWADPPEGLSLDQRRRINNLLAHGQDQEAAELVVQWTDRDPDRAMEFLDQHYAELRKLAPHRFPARHVGNPAKNP